MDKKKKTLCFDLDNVICKTVGNNYRKSTPKKKAILEINKLFLKHKIIIFTARFMGRTNNNITKSKKLGYSFTQNQLKKWKVSYHKLIFGKPSFDYIVDDKAVGFSDNNWIKILKKKLK